MLDGAKIVQVRLSFVFFFQAEDGIRDLVRSRGLGDVYKRQSIDGSFQDDSMNARNPFTPAKGAEQFRQYGMSLFLSLIHI